MANTVSWPTDKWRPMAKPRFAVQPVNIMSQSPYTGAPLAIALAQAWQVELAWNNTSLSDAFEMQAFLEGLDGNATRVKLFDHWRPVPRLLAPAEGQTWSDSTFWSDGTGWADMSIIPLALYDYDRGAQIMVVQGLPLSQDILLPGDLFQIGEGLHVVTRKVRGDAYGRASVHFKPGLRAAVAAGDELRLYMPRGVFRMTSSPVAIAMAITNAEPFTLTFTEDVP